MTSDPFIMDAVKTLRERRAAIDRAIAALEDLDARPSPAVKPSSIESAEAFGQSTVSAGATRRDGSGGAAGARRVLTARPGHGFTPEELAAAMRANGWKADTAHPARAARAAANRLRRDVGESVFLEDGRFVYRPDPKEQAGNSLTFDSANGAESTSSNREAV